MDHVDTVCTEATAFAARHPELPADAQALGMLAWGLLRALLACDVCGVGHYRIPQDADWNVLVCPTCGGRWVKREPLKQEHANGLSLISSKRRKRAR